MNAMTSDKATPADFLDMPPLCLSFLHQAALLLRSDNPAAMQYIAKANSLLTDSQIRAEAFGGKGGLSLWQARKVTSYITTNLHRPIKLEELAAICNRSVGSLSVTFKCTFGITPHAYILKQRVEIAKRAILETNNPLCDIAIDCGLSDQSHLTRMFRRFVGVPPGIWRRQQLGGKDEAEIAIGR
jgi:AraC family transcriptional regulator